jgi:hypothetical protein
MTAVTKAVRPPTRTTCTVVDVVTEPTDVPTCVTETETTETETDTPVDPPCTAPSVPVLQGRLTMSAVAFQVVSGGAGELTVLAPLALRVR